MQNYSHGTRRYDDASTWFQRRIWESSARFMQGLTAAVPVRKRFQDPKLCIL